MLPMGSSPGIQHPSPSGIQIKSGASKPAIHIKQEGSQSLISLSPFDLLLQAIIMSLQA